MLKLICLNYIKKYGNKMECYTELYYILNARDKKKEIALTYNLRFYTISLQY